MPVLLFQGLSTIIHCQNTLVYSLLEEYFRTLSSALGCDIFRSLSLDFYLCLFLFVVSVSGQLGQIITVKLCNFSL